MHIQPVQILDDDTVHIHDISEYVFRKTHPRWIFSNSQINEWKEDKKKMLFFIVNSFHRKTFYKNLDHPILLGGCSCILSVFCCVFFFFSKFWSQILLDTKRFVMLRFLIQSLMKLFSTIPFILTSVDYS